MTNVLCPMPNNILQQIIEMEENMKDKLLHTPEGVRDIYNTECAVKLLLQNNLHEVLKRHGFRDIQTPSFEFFDIFNHERGTVSSKDMYHQALNSLIFSIMNGERFHQRICISCLIKKVIPWCFDRILPLL